MSKKIKLKDLLKENFSSIGGVVSRNAFGDSMSLSETNEINLSLTPNPSSDYLFLNTDLSEFVIEIYDFLGKKVHFSENTNRINIKDLANGMYLLNIKSGSFSSSKVFIKK